MAGSGGPRWSSRSYCGGPHGVPAPFVSAATRRVCALLESGSSWLGALVGDTRRQCRWPLSCVGSATSVSVTSVSVW